MWNGLKHKSIIYGNFIIQLSDSLTFYLQTIPVHILYILFSSYKMDFIFLLLYKWNYISWIVSRYTIHIYDWRDGSAVKEEFLSTLQRIHVQVAITHIIEFTNACSFRSRWYDNFYWLSQVTVCDMYVIAGIHLWKPAPPGRCHDPNSTSGKACQGVTLPQGGSKKKNPKWWTTPTGSLGCHPEKEHLVSEFCKVSPAFSFQSCFHRHLGALH